MKTYKQLIEDNIKWLVPDYPEQILSKDDPEGNWVTGDSQKPIEFPPTENTPSEGINPNPNVLSRDMVAEFVVPFSFRSLALKSSTLKIIII